jgi:hypothetical protein
MPVELEQVLELTAQLFGSLFRDWFERYLYASWTSIGQFFGATADRVLAFLNEFMLQSHQFARQVLG